MDELLSDYNDVGLIVCGYALLDVVKNGSKVKDPTVLAVCLARGAVARCLIGPLVRVTEAVHSFLRDMSKLDLVCQFIV